MAHALHFTAERKGLKEKANSALALPLYKPALSTA
jgi:hypothetical protein